MEKYFRTEKERMVIDKIMFTYEQFLEVILKHKPKEIFNNEWSSKSPFIIIEKYNEDTTIEYFCDGHNDKSLILCTIKNLYDFLKYQGLSDCRIKLECKHKVNGSCELHNLFCVYPKCEE
jgi:hypothetical protein